MSLLLLFTASVIIKKIFSMPCKTLKQAVFCCAADSPAPLFAVTLQQLQEKQRVKQTGAAWCVPLSCGVSTKPRKAIQTL